MPAIVPVVEGDGEVEAAPLLIRRLLAERYDRQGVRIAKPKNAHGRDRLVRDLERFVRYAAMTPDCQAVLVLLDAHGDCPRRLGPQLADRCRQLGLNMPIAVVCARQEYEAWFLASLETLREEPIKGKPGLSDSAQWAQPVEDVSGVKEWLTRHLPPGRSYKETTDQAPLTEYLDFSLARDRSRSFRRLCHAVEQLLQTMDKGTATVTP